MKCSRKRMQLAVAKSKAGQKYRRILCRGCRKGKSSIPRVKSGSKDTDISPLSSLFSAVAYGNAVFGMQERQQLSLQRLTKMIKKAEPL